MERKAAKEAGNTPTQPSQEFKKSKTIRGKSRKRKRNDLDKSFCEEAEYEIEDIIFHKEHYGKVSKYFVKWKGWSDEENTWEPFENLRGCLDTVVNYFEKKIIKENSVPRGITDTTSQFLALKKKLSEFPLKELEDAARHYFTVDGDVIPPFDMKMTESNLKILALLPPSARDFAFIKEVRQTLLFNKLKKKRAKQLEALKYWEIEINILYKNRSPPIKVYNTVDLEGPPSNFIYVDRYIPGYEVTIPTDPPFGCSCTGTCLRKKCLEDHACDKSYVNGILKVPRGTAIYECNKKCKCSMDCGNRVVQKGRQFPLCIFRTHNGCGWGIKTLVKIPKGSFVCQYVGEVIKTEEAERRGKEYDKEGMTYLFDLDFEDKIDFPYTVDAKVYGNISHFINHSCNPNLEVFAVWVDCMDRNIPNLCLFASKNIKEGDELSFDYLCQPLVENKRFPTSCSVKTICRCESQNCRKYLF